MGVKQKLNTQFAQNLTVNKWQMVNDGSSGTYKVETREIQGVKDLLLYDL